MRKPFTVRILSEFKNEWERRAPLTPRDVRWLVERRIPVEVVASELRIFKNTEYRAAGARIVHPNKKPRPHSRLCLGVKEPPLETLLPKQVYMVFSHTTKGQKTNRPLLQTFVESRITLIDYEHIEDLSGQRTAYFGRFAGICGMIDSLHQLGRKYELRGINSPFLYVRPALSYGCWKRAKRHLRQIAAAVKKHGLPAELTPFITGITGHGHVSSGAQEVLELFRPVEIHPNDMKHFIRHQKKRFNQIYKIVFTREEKLRAKNRKGFYFEDYLERPEFFESNLDQYLPHLNLLINATYWDKRYPRLVTESMIRKLARRKRSRLTLVGDLTCDVNGSVEITKKTTDPGNPTFVYDPKTKQIHDGIEGDGIVVLAVDNLPCEFPADASEAFGAQIRDYVYQIASHAAYDVTNHAAIPAEIRRAVVTEGGKLTELFSRLKKYL